MSELVGLVLILLGVWMLNRRLDSLWSDAAKRVTRKECRGKLYWVIEDGDKDKFEHVKGWFSDDSKQSD